jgi:predicted nucleic acid-binding Zn ribbon protein
VSNKSVTTCSWCTQYYCIECTDGVEHPYQYCSEECEEEHEQELTVNDKTYTKKKKENK